MFVLEVRVQYTIKYIIQSLRYITGGGASNCRPCSDHILLGRSNEVRTDYMSGEIKGGLGEMKVATTDSVLARQLSVQKWRVCMCSLPRWVHYTLGTILSINCLWLALNIIATHASHIARSYCTICCLQGKQRTDCGKQRRPILPSFSQHCVWWFSKECVDGLYIISRTCSK